MLKTIGDFTLYVAVALLLLSISNISIVVFDIIAHIIYGGVGGDVWASVPGERYIPIVVGAAILCVPIMFTLLFTHDKRRALIKGILASLTVFVLAGAFSSATDMYLLSKASDPKNEFIRDIDFTAVARKAEHEDFFTKSLQLGDRSYKLYQYFRYY